jgi:dissimilatory sulfite reductase (desulfoviridin) alpha/beta subunit
MSLIKEYMIQVLIKKQGILTNKGIFETLQLAEDWYNDHLHIFAEHEVEIHDISNDLQIQKINEECLEYLKSTDWMIIRELDTGILCPIEVKQARQEARNKIIK